MRGIFCSQSSSASGSRRALAGDGGLCALFGAVREVDVLDGGESFRFLSFALSSSVRRFRSPREVRMASRRLSSSSSLLQAIAHGGDLHFIELAVFSLR